MRRTGERRFLLEKNGHVMEHCEEVNRLEDMADNVSRRAIADLFENEKDPIQLIKLKELYEVLESAPTKQRTQPTCSKPSSSRALAGIREQNFTNQDFASTNRRDSVEQRSATGPDYDLCRPSLRLPERLHDSANSMRRWSRRACFRRDLPYSGPPSSTFSLLLSSARPSPIPSAKA